MALVSIQQFTGLRRHYRLQFVQLSKVSSLKKHINSKKTWVRATNNFDYITNLCQKSYSDTTETKVCVVKLWHIYFTERTPVTATLAVSPLVPTTAVQHHARLSIFVIIRLSWVPVGVCHFGHRVTVVYPISLICRDNSPDEPRSSRRDYALSCRPHGHIRIVTAVRAHTSRCLWNNCTWHITVNDSGHVISQNHWWLK